MNLRWHLTACLIGATATISQSIGFGQTESPQYLGSGSCARCHETPSPTDIQSGATGRICLTEWKTWTSADPHANAHAALKNDRGQRIGQLLGKDVFAAQTGCIQCHNTAFNAKDIVPSAVAVTLAEGVGCESCHGPSSKWQNDHWRYPDWQQKTVEQRREFGWIEINSPITRAEVCASCHIGDANQNRLITHDMYAAGHPPLSGFEIESFADNMPRHWMYPYERTSPKATFGRTRNVLVGSVIALRKSVELAMADAAAPIEPHRWPELARLDCFACHHELTSQDWRQTPVSLTTPGRPQLAAGCLPLVAVAAGTVGVKQDSMTAIIAKLQEPFTQNIFGDAGQLTQNGSEVVAWCKAVENSLAERKFQIEDARAILRAIAKQAESKPCDFDTARQLFGAWQVVFEEYAAPRPTEFVEVRQRLQQMNGSNQFALNRDNRNSPCDPPPASDPAAQSQEYANLLNELHRARVDYDPDEFKHDMADLAKLIGP